MSRRKRKTTTPPVFKNRVETLTSKTTPVLSEVDVKRLMASYILGGMMSNPRKNKFNVNDLIEKSVQHAQKIIDITD
jgi:hypothetical protein